MDGNYGPALAAGRFDEPRPPALPNTLARREAFETRHPQVKITSGRKSKSGLWEADWPGREEPVGHDKCAGLLDYLEARFDRGDLRAGPTLDDLCGP